MKDSFEFILAMYSIIIGLGVSRLLEGVKNFVVHGKSLRGSGLYVGMLVIGLLVHAMTWLSLWGLRNVDNWTPGSFLLVMLVPVLMYLFSCVTVPDDSSTDDMGAYYLINARKMHALLMTAIVANALTEPLIAGHPFSIRLTAVRIAISTLLLACAVMPRMIWLHRVLVPTVIIAAILLIPLVDFPIR